MIAWQISATLCFQRSMHASPAVIAVTPAVNSGLEYQDNSSRTWQQR
jgi:hypothetical protein